jgi:hypothetical protein
MMECTYCHKHVNEGTAFCDACGEELMTSHRSVSISELSSIVLPPIIERYFSATLEEELKNAYYVSQVKRIDNEGSWEHMQLYFDYIYLRLMYEQDKDRFLSQEYPKEVALTVLNAFKTQSIEQEVRVILQQRYGELYQQHQLPSEVIAHIPQIYDCSNRELYRRIKGRTIRQAIGRGIVSFVKLFFLLGVIGLGYIGYTLYTEVGLDGINQTVLLDALSTHQNAIMILAGIAVAWGIQKAWNVKRDTIKRELFQTNKVLKKQIRKEVKPLFRKVKRRKI